MAGLTSSEYWQKRAERILIENEKTALEYEKDLRKAYDRALLQMQKEVDAFYNKYVTNNQIDLATARQRLNPQELKDFRAQAKIYLDEAKRLGLDPQYKDYLKELSSKAYISKLEEIQANIRFQLEKLEKSADEGMGDILEKGYEDAYYKTSFDVQKQVGFTSNFTVLGNQQVERAVQTKWLGANYSDRIWNNKNSLLQQLDQLIPQQFVRGKGSYAVGKQLANKLNTSYKNAVRLIRTEMNHISSQAALKSYRDSDIVDRYEFLATLDNRTSEICRELDGKVFKVSEGKAGINLPPMHPNCRSTTVPYFPDDDITEPLQRIARDRNGNGNSYILHKDLTYKEWKRLIVDPSINNPYILRINHIPPNKEGISILKNLKDEYNLIPAEHLKILENYIEKIEMIGSDHEEPSHYDRKKKILYLRNDFIPGEMIHEMGHALETALDFIHNEDYLKVLEDGLSNITPEDVILDKENFIKDIKRISNKKFISIYQGMIYPKDSEGNEPFDADKKFNTKVLGEYFSEGYREYLQNPNNLKEKDPKLYEFIESTL